MLIVSIKEHVRDSLVKGLDDFEDIFATTVFFLEKMSLNRGRVRI